MNLLIPFIIGLILGFLFLNNFDKFQDFIPIFEKINHVKNN